MPVPEQGSLLVLANPLCLVGLDLQLAVMADVTEVGGHCAQAPAAAGHFDHDFRRSSDGTPNVLDLLARETLPLWTRPTGAKQVEEGSLRGRVSGSPA